MLELLENSDCNAAHELGLLQKDAAAEVKLPNMKGRGTRTSLCLRWLFQGASEEQQLGSKAFQATKRLFFPRSCLHI